MHREGLQLGQTGPKRGIVSMEQDSAEGESGFGGIQARSGFAVQEYSGSKADAGSETGIWARHP